MHLFQELYPMLDGVDINITVKRKGEKLTVAILPKGETTDPAKNYLTPLTMTATPAELDEAFLSAIKEPVKKATGLLTSMAEFEQSTKKAESESKAKASEKEKTKKANDEKKKKYDKMIAKADQFEKDKELKKAIGALNEAKKFTDKPTELDKRINDLVNQLSQGTLFGTESADDLRNTKYEATEKEEESPADQEEEEETNEAEEEQE